MNPKSFSMAALAAAVVAGAVLAPPSSSGQLGGDDPVVLNALVTEVTNQQATLADNQNKIDAKLAGIAENIRLARIYAGRGGGKTP